jgi:CheY-like chemotaxis protein
MISALPVRSGWHDIAGVFWRLQWCAGERRSPGSCGGIGDVGSAVAQVLFKRGYAVVVRNGLPQGDPGAHSAWAVRVEAPSPPHRTLHVPRYEDATLSDGAASCLRLLLPIAFRRAFDTRPVIVLPDTFWFGERPFASSALRYNAAQYVRGGRTITVQRHILLADDDLVFLTGIADLLRHGGYRVTEARHFTTALSALDNADDRPDILVTDIVMPRSINGVALGRMARMRYPHLPVIYLTAYDVGRAVDQETSGTIIRKPIEAAKLLVDRI